MKQFRIATIVLCLSFIDPLLAKDGINMPFYNIEIPPDKAIIVNYPEFEPKTQTIYCHDSNHVDSNMIMYFSHHQHVFKNNALPIVFKADNYFEGEWIDKGSSFVLTNLSSSVKSIVLSCVYQTHVQNTLE